MKFENVNLLRGFAALWVVMYHIIEKSHWASFPFEGPLLTFRVGWMGVHLFFVISGFVITYSATRLLREAPESFQHEYWLRRLTRIVPLYLLTIGMWIAVEPHGQGLRYWAWQIIAHVSFTHSFWQDTHSSIDGVNWTLALEMHFYLATALLIRWIDRTPAWRIALYGVLISWSWRGCMFMLYGHQGTWPLFTHVTQFPGMLDEFCAGIALAKWTLNGNRIRPYHALYFAAIGGAVGFVVMHFYWGYSSFWEFPYMVVFWHSGLAIFFGCLVACAVCLPQVLAHKALFPLNWIGEISYGIYLWHLFALDFLVRTIGTEPWPVMFGTLAATIIVAGFSWRYFEAPIMRLARPVKQRNPRHSRSLLEVEINSQPVDALRGDR